MSKGIQEIKQRLARGSEQQRLAALSEALNYGQQGLDLIISQSLKDSSERVKQSAYWIIHGYNPYLTGNSTQKSPPCPIDTITSLAMSPDNKILAGGSWKKIWVWHLQTGEIFDELSVHSHWVLSVAITPDGNTVVSGSADKTIKVWNIKTGQIRTLDKHSSWVNAVVISPDGKTIIIGSADKTIKVWDLDTGKLKTTIKKEKELQSVVSLAISPDGKVIASGDTTNKITLWNWESAQVIRTLEGHSSWIQSLSITSDSKALISGSRDGTLKVWQSNSDSEEESLDPNQFRSNLVKGFVDVGATALWFSGAWYVGVPILLGRLLFNGNSSTQLPVKSLECVNTCLYNQAINSLDCSLDRIIIGYKNKIQISSLKDKRNIDLPGECNFISSVAINSDGKIFASAGNDWIMLWDVQTGKALHPLQGCSYPKLSEIKIIPEASQEILCGKSLQFTVKGLDQKKREINLKDEDIKWEPTGGKIQQGLFTAGQREGKFKVKARVGIFEVSVPIAIIEPPRISKFILTPHTVTLEFGKTQQFTGRVLDQRGNPMSQETVSWKVSSKDGGTIDQYGNFKAGYNPGKFEIIASVGSIQRSILVIIIEPPKLKNLIITSSTPKLDFGQSFQFKVKGVDQYGNYIKTRKVTWSATSGRIDTNDGLFYASNREETVTIHATVGEINTYVKIEICEPSRLTKIEVFPSSVILEPGREQKFSVVCFNQRDEEISVGDIHWNSTGGISINQSGYFRTEENQKGRCEVTVTVGHLSATAEVVVPAILRRIQISPEQVELKPDEEFLFTVTGFDQTGDRLEIKNAQWSTTAGGSITPKGLFKGNYKQREVTVIAIAGQISATAKINLLPVLKRLEIYPGFVYLKPGEKQKFTVKGFDQFGGEITPSEIYWERTGGKINQNGLLTVTDDDQGYIQVTATSKLTPKYSQNVRTLLLYTGIFSEIISLLFSYETRLKDLLALDSGSAEAKEQLGDSAEAEEKLDIDTDTNQDTDTIVQVEEGLDVESAGGTEADTLLDPNVLDFNVALQEWLFQKLRKLAARFFSSVSRFCLNEATANLSASADVFVLAVENNPYKYFECLKFLEGHSGFVASLAITPDGQRLISGSWDSTIIIWDLNTGNLLRTLVDHEYDVACVAITPDGQQLISSSWDNTIKIWDLNTSELMPSLEFPELVVFVAITSDGRQLISCQRYNIITVLDLKNRTILKTYEIYSSDYYYYHYHRWHEGRNYWWHYWWRQNCTIITPDNRTLIAGRKFIKVYDLETGKLLTILGVNLGWISALAITPDGKKLISSHDRIIRIWDLKVKRSDILLTLESSAQEIYALVVTPDGQRIVSAGCRIISNLESEEITNSESWIEIWDLNTGERLHFIEEYANNDNCVYCLAITPDGKQIISGYTDGTIKVWGVPELTTLSTPETGSFG